MLGTDSEYVWRENWVFLKFLRSFGDHLIMSECSTNVRWL